jgi:hypothetical protein
MIPSSRALLLSLTNLPQPNKDPILSRECDIPSLSSLARGNEHDFPSPLSLAKA